MPLNIFFFRICKPPIFLLGYVFFGLWQFRTRLSLLIIHYTEKTRTEDTSEEYQNLYAQRYAYSILLPATKVRTTDTICGTVKIVHLISYSEAFVYTPMEVKYICDIYNFWKRKYIILASFKYMSSVFKICRIYFGKYIYIYKIYVKYILNVQLLKKIYFIHFDIYLTYIFFPFFSMSVIWFVFKYHFL